MLTLQQPSVTAANGASAAGLETYLHAFLQNRNWQVVKNFYVYNPQTEDYAECDVLAISRNAILLVEAKRWFGNWIAHEEGDFPKWFCPESQKAFRSPVFQVQRTRALLLEVTSRIFLGHQVSPAELLPLTQTSVVMNPWCLQNAEDPTIQSAWERANVQVFSQKAWERNIPYQKKQNHVSDGTFQMIVDYARCFMRPDGFGEMSYPDRKAALRQMYAQWRELKQERSGK